MATLDSLQSMLEENTPQMRMPCPRMAAAQQAQAAQEQANMANMLPFMASARFGQALLPLLAQQVSLRDHALIAKSVLFGLKVVILVLT